MGVDDLDLSYRYCTASGCNITQPPHDAPFGDRVFEMIDPYGYQWEISQPILEPGDRDLFAATREAWFSECVRRAACEDFDAAVRRAEDMRGVIRPRAAGGNTNFESRMRDPEGYLVVLESPHGSPG